MKIQNIRFGHANNSSSTHSIVFLNRNYGDCDVYNYEFGWDNFTAQSTKAKLAYLGHVLSYNNVLNNPYKAEGYVDHQSVFNIPRRRDGSHSDEFVKDLADFLSRPDIAILGGNDDDGESHRLLNEGMPIDRLDGYSLQGKCRKQKGIWTIYEESNGNKARFSFDNIDTDLEFKSETPELVDVKITDYCPYGCSYCYMGSTISGKKNRVVDVAELAKVLDELDVFEVALGGGEPTLDPDFVDILKIFRQHNITPNFTTRNLNALKNEEIIGLAGSAAYSIESIRDLMDLPEPYQSKVRFQLVMGLVDRAEFERILRYCRAEYLSLTLLGYKTTGFGENFAPQPYHWWPESVKKYYKRPIAIDTLLASQTDLKKYGVSKTFYHTVEGQSSCYIDAVDGKIGASSYYNLFSLSGDLKTSIMSHFSNF